MTPGSGCSCRHPTCSGPALEPALEPALRSALGLRPRPGTPAPNAPNGRSERPSARPVRTRDHHPSGPVTHLTARSCVSLLPRRENPHGGGDGATCVGRASMRRVSAPFVRGPAVDGPMGRSVGRSRRSAEVVRSVPAVRGVSEQPGIFSASPSQFQHFFRFFVTPRHVSQPSGEVPEARISLSEATSGHRSGVITTQWRRQAPVSVASRPAEDCNPRGRIQLRIAARGSCSPPQGSAPRRGLRGVRRWEAHRDASHCAA